MKKILVIGPMFYGYSESVAKGFIKNGYKVKTIVWKKPQKFADGSIFSTRYITKILYVVTKDGCAAMPMKYKDF